MRNEVNNQGNWKTAAAEDDSPMIGFDLAGIVASMGLVVLAALVWMNTANAALPKVGAESVAWKSGNAAVTCEDKLSSLYLAGSFMMPGSAEPMQLWVGKPTADSKKTEDKEVWGLVAKSKASLCEAQCKVTRFERFKKDMKPALMEMDCEGSTLKTMRMPLHIQWVRNGKNAFDTVVRLGSSLYGVEQTALRVEVNRYSVASK